MNQWINGFNESMILADLPNKRSDRIVRRFRLIVEDEHAGVGNPDEFKLLILRHQGFPRIQKRRLRKAVRRIGEELVVKAGHQRQDRDL